MSRPVAALPRHLHGCFGLGQRFAQVSITALHFGHFFEYLPIVILSVRTWAVWNRGLLLGIGLGLLLIVSWIPNIPIILIFTRSLDCKSLFGVGFYAPCPDKSFASLRDKTSATSRLSSNQGNQYCVYMLDFATRQRIW